MKMLFKQRLFSWLDSYDIYDEDNNVIYVIKGEIALGHFLRIYDALGNEIGFIEQKLITFMPKFNVYIDGEYVGCIEKEFSFFKPIYNIDFNGWNVEGDIFEFDYNITNDEGSIVATISKELMHLTDQYVIDVQNPSDALSALMLVVAIDAEKCSRK